MLTAPLRITVQICHDKDHFAALVDTGASRSIVNKSFVTASAKHGYQVVPKATTLFDTMGQDVGSNGTLVAQFRFAKLETDSVITHRFQVIQDSKDAIVIGRDFLRALGITINFRDQTIHWDEQCLQVNTGGNEGLTTRLLDTDFVKEYKELADSSVSPKELAPDHLPLEVLKRYMDLLEHYHQLYDGHFGRIRLMITSYHLPLSTNQYTQSRIPFHTAKKMHPRQRSNG